MCYLLHNVFEDYPLILFINRLLFSNMQLLHAYITQILSTHLSLRHSYYVFSTPFLFCVCTLFATLDILDLLDPLVTYFIN